MIHLTFFFVRSSLWTENTGCKRPRKSNGGRNGAFFTLGFYFDRYGLSISDCVAIFAESHGSPSCGISWGAVWFPPLTCTVFLFVSLFILSVSVPLSHSLSLSLILFHENNRASLSSGTVIQLQTSPCFWQTLNSAYLSMFSCHCLSLRLKFPHCFFL